MSKSGTILVFLFILAAAILATFAWYTIPSPAAPAPPPPAPTLPVASYLDPVRGASTASTTVFEFGDFECPSCASTEPALAQLLSAHPDVRLVWKDFPLPIHENAQDAAEAARCAGDQGKFWEFHDALISHQDQLGADLYPTIAGDLKLDVNTFAACLVAHPHAEQISKTFDEGAAAGVDQVPYFFINGKPLSGQTTVDAFEQTLKNSK